MKINSLTPSEEQLMRIIWLLNGAYTKEILSAYPEPKPHQNTVSTFLKLLVEKDYLNIEKKGRIFKYIPSFSFEVYRKHHLNEFVKSYYENDINLLLADFEDPKGTPKKQVNIADNNMTTAEASAFVEEILAPKKEKKEKKEKKGKSKEKKKKKK